MLRYIFIIIWAVASVFVAAAVWGLVRGSAFMIIGLFVDSPAEVAGPLAWVAAGSVVLLTFLFGVLGKLPGTGRRKGNETDSR